MISITAIANGSLSEQFQRTSKGARPALGAKRKPESIRRKVAKGRPAKAIPSAAAA